MKNRIYFIVAIFILTSCSIIKKEEALPYGEPAVYRINDYIINPSEKKIYSKGNQMVERKDINYKKTKLIILGCKIAFQESFKTRKKLSKMKFLHSSSFVTDGKKVYYENHGKLEEVLDISGYEPIHDFLYQKNGKLYVYFPSRNNDELTEVTGLDDFDISSVQYIKGRYFTTKDGLYWLGPHSENDNKSSFWSYNSLLLEKYEGEESKPTFYPDYLTYNRSVYAYDNSKIIKLDLDAQKTRRILWDPLRERVFLSDGHTTYESEEWGYKLVDRVRLPILPPDVYQWVPINDISFFIIEGEDLYIPESLSDLSDKRHTNREGIVVWTPTGFYVIDPENFDREPIRNIWIKNYQTGEYEVLDPGRYELYTNSFYVYKNRAYSFFKPVLSEIEVTKMRYFSERGNVSNFLTDGKYLLYMGKEGLSLPQPDFDSLRMVDKDILIDKDYIYNGRNMMVIPRKKLGIEVIVL